MSPFVRPFCYEWQGNAHLFCALLPGAWKEEQMGGVYTFGIINQAVLVKCENWIWFQNKYYLNPGACSTKQDYWVSWITALSKTHKAGLLS